MLIICSENKLVIFRYGDMASESSSHSESQWLPCDVCSFSFLQFIEYRNYCSPNKNRCFHRLPEYQNQMENIRSNFNGIKSGLAMKEINRKIF